LRKVFLVLFLGAIGAVFCFSPAKQVKGIDEKKRVTVLSTTAMIDDIVRQVGGERVSSSALIRGGIDPHGYEPMKGDDEKIDSADVVFFNGLQLEHGAGLTYKLSTHPASVALGDYVFAKYPEYILFEEGNFDPHIWMDVSLWAKIIDPVVDALSKADPEGAEYYKEKGALLEQKMLAFHEELKSRFKAVPEEKRYLVTSHDAFAYFTRSYLAEEKELAEDVWRKRVAAPEGLAPEGQIGVMQLQKIIDYLEKYRVEVVFPESNVSRDSLKKIVFACKEKKIPVRFSSDHLYGDCMGEAESYLAMIESNGRILLKEWEGGL